MKKSLILLIVCVFMLCAPAAAFADVIWEPVDDFYTRHADECEYVGRMYIVNGAQGYANVYESPDSGRVTDTIENGNELYISFSYENMGIAEYKTEEGKLVPDYSGEGSSGWIHMSDMVVKYDSQAFREEHAAEIGEFTGNLADYVPAGSEVYFYDYPNSGSHYDVLETDENFMVESVYTDENGRVWGHVGYYYGIRDCWVCLDEPDNGEIPEIERKYEGLVPPKAPDGKSAERTGDDRDVSLLVVVIVAAVTVVTVALLLTVFRRKK